MRGITTRGATTSFAEDEMKRSEKTTIFRRERQQDFDIKTNAYVDD
jgi:hypothetical protein